MAGVCKHLQWSSLVPLVVLLSVTAADAVVVRVTDGLIVPVTGTTTVEVSIDDAAGTEAAFVQVQYDPAIVQATAVSIADPTNCLMEFNANANNNSAVNLAIACSEPLDGNDSLFTITFEGQGSGNSPLDITLCHLNEGNPPCTAIDASITVTPCALDVDGSGAPPSVATDVVYVARRLLGFVDVVPPSFRELDPSIPDDSVIAAQVTGVAPGLDVDQDGNVSVATDVVYIARRLLGFVDVVPPSFRALDPTIPPDTQIGGNIDALCG